VRAITTLDVLSKGSYQNPTTKVLTSPMAFTIAITFNP
jgi:hypothetical protein